MRSYEITIRGISPLLMHHDDIDWADQMEKWKVDNTKAGAKRELSKAGDDRTPAHRWIGSLYKGRVPSEDGVAEEVVAMPVDNIMRAIMGGATTVLIPGRKNGKTFKAESQSGILPDSTVWPLLIDGKIIPYAPIKALLKERDFEKHKEVAEKLGFSLFLKRARVGASKHVRVRPRFEVWALSGILKVRNELITQDVLEAFLERGGSDHGLGDWRPSSPKAPGSYGMFTAAVKPVKTAKASKVNMDEAAAMASLN
jgi:hypothetical protein